MAFAGLFCGFYMTLITMAHSYLTPFFLEFEKWQYGNVRSFRNIYHKEKVCRLACSRFEDEFYSACHQPAVQYTVYTLTKGVFNFCRCLMLAILLPIVTLYTQVNTMKMNASCRAGSQLRFGTSYVKIG